MRVRYLIAALSLLSQGTASAQLVYAVPKDERVAKRYAKNLTTFQGVKALIGEPKTGITCTPGNITKTGGSEAKNELYVGDPSDPTFVPYKWEKGRRVRSGKRSVVTFAGDDFPIVKYVDQLQTLHGVATEYGIRMEEVEHLQEERDTFDKGTVGWFGKHGMAIARLDRLSSWLVNMGYPDAAKKLSRKIKKEKKQVSKEASAIREKAALNSVKMGKIPERLVAASQKITGGKVKFGVVESQHCRIIYPTSLSDGVAQAGLQLCEKIIESFRKDFVDPYRDDDFREYIPDDRFIEFCFVPDNRNCYENFKIEYYGLGWNSRRKEESLNMAGTSFMQGPTRGDAEFVRYWKLNAEKDIEGIIAHSTGHVLASLHYNRGGIRGGQAWIDEAVAYYVSFGHLGRNSVTCFSWNEPSYAKPANEEGEKTVAEGLRGYFNELALTQGPSIEALASKNLADMSDVDFAKAWSLFDYVALEKDRAGQVWLRNTCLAAQSRNKSDFSRRWREFTEQLQPVNPGEDVFNDLNEKWRKYAKARQSKN